MAVPPSFPSVAAGTAAAVNSVAVKIKNTGDAALTITNLRDRRRTPLDVGSQNDFAIVSQNCFARSPQRRRDRDRAPAGPARHLHRQGRLQADALELPVRRAPADHLQRRRRDRAVLLTGQEHR